jgi:hypothetical protein
VGEIIPELYAIDLDKTVYRTDIAFGKMVRLAVAGGLAARRTIESARIAVEATEGSFDLLAYLGEQGVPDGELSELQTLFGDNRERDDFLYPDARNLFTALRDTATPFFTHTKGGWATQAAKLRSCRLPAGTLLDEPYVITNNTNKGEDIAALAAGRARYEVPVLRGTGSRETLVARTIFLLEDKPQAFANLPADCSGARVDRSHDTGQGRAPALLYGRIPTIPDLGIIVKRVYQNAAPAA